MNYPKAFIPIAFFLLISNFAIAQTPIYLEVGDCTKEMHYTHSNSSNYFSEYYDYHFALNGYETVVLEVSKTNLSKLTFSELPHQNITTCGSTKFDEQISYETIGNIQNGQQEVYIVKRIDGGYTVGKVESATYQFYLQEDNFLRVIQEDISFDYNANNIYDPGEELIQDGQGSFVFYTEQYERCYKKPIFMHVPTNFMEAATLEYALGVGLLRAYSDDMEKKLIAINGKNVNYYLDVFCGLKEPLVVNNESLELIDTEEEIIAAENNINYIDQEAAAFFEVDQTYNTKGVEEVVLPQDLTLTELTEATKKVELETAVNTAKLAKMAELGMSEYTVKQGDTLYNISKRYNLTTLQIKKLNDLNSNVIEIGQTLFLR